MAFYIVLTYFALLLNLGAPPLVSSASSLVLFAEHTTVLFVSRVLIFNTIGRSSKKVNDLYYRYFLIGLAVSMIAMHFVWTPGLNPNLERWGFDPQRYYYYATEIVREGYLFYSLNYQGVVYFYVGCMKLFGVDPLIPLYVNTLLALYATILIARVFSTGNELSKYAVLLLIPEVVCFNFMPSREILCMAGATVFIVKYIEFSKHHTIIDITLLILSFLLVAVVRPPMAAPLIFGIIVRSMLHATMKKMLGNVVILGVMAAVMTVAMGISNDLGSNFNEESLEETVSSGVSGNNEARADAASSGMTVWLIPHNPVEYVIFGIIRSFAYVIPPPLMVTDFFHQFSLMDTAIYPNLTVIFMFFLLPSIYYGLRRLKTLPEEIQLIAIVLVIYFLMIGVTLTNLIHQRYRIVYDLFFFGFGIYCWIHKKELRGNKITILR